MKPAKKMSKGLEEYRNCVPLEERLPNCAQIHPSMPLLLQDSTVAMCERFNISIWDRDKLWSKLTMPL